MSLRDLLYRAYVRRLAASLVGKPMPRHVGVIVDGNRRWAREMGYPDAAHGHQAGADRIKDLLRWCDQAGIGHVTLWLLSNDNFSRPPAELAALLRIIGTLAGELAADGNPWRLHVMGSLDLFPAAGAEVFKAAVERTAHRSGGAQVNLAVGYGGRREIADAVRALLLEHAAAGTPIEELAETLDAGHIEAHLYTKGQPDPDLLIRTSGEQRLSGFLLWQSAHSEFYFCDVYWPGFRQVDFLRALRSYAGRQRRFGT